MADTTRSTSDLAARRRLGIPDTSPRPVSQSLWILASVAAAGLAVLSASSRVEGLGATITTALEGGAAVEGSDLIELADRQQSIGSTGGEAAEPASAVEPEPGGPTATISAAPATEPREHVQVGRAALADISYPWEQLLSGWTVEFLPATEGLYGLTMVPERRIEIYVRADQSPGMISHVIAHELGHAIDVTFNDGPDRRRWSELRDLGSAPWWPDSGATDFATGAGDFAESFAAWQVGPSGFRSTLGDPPTGPQIELLAELSTG